MTREEFMESVQAMLDIANKLNEVNESVANGGCKLTAMNEIVELINELDEK